MARRSAVARVELGAPLGCGVQACGAPAAVVVCDLLAAALARSLGKLRPCEFGTVNQGRRRGLCEGHWREARPGSRLEFSGVCAAIPPGVVVEYEPAAPAAVVESVTVGEGKASRDVGAGSDGGARRRGVGARRSADRGPAAVKPAKPVRLGFTQDPGGRLHDAGGASVCQSAATFRGQLKVRRLTRAEWEAATRCACARWMGGGGA